LLPTGGSTREEVYRLLSNAPDLVRWWPSVYLDVKEIEPGDENGLGNIIILHTRGWLPYTLRWRFRVTRVSYPEGYALEPGVIRRARMLAVRAGRSLGSCDL
jgi:hypothetical protein